MRAQKLRQGHYALDPHNLSTYPPADLAIERMGDLRHFNLSMLVGPARGRDRGQEAT